MINKHSKGDAIMVSDVGQNILLVTSEFDSTK
jgi:hypothetical protein